MTTKGILVGAVGIVILMLLVGLIVIYSGTYNVAASYPHHPIARWMFETTMKQSVRQRADEVPAPPLDLAQLETSGLRYYREMCVVCHGAPGVEPGEAGKGLRPEAPDLSKAVPEWSDKELFWIIKHGVRLTGMPAWGETHDDKEMWSMVAFLKRLPSLNAEQYKTMVNELAPKEAGH